MLSQALGEVYYGNPAGTPMIGSAIDPTDRFLGQQLVTYPPPIPENAGVPVYYAYYSGPYMQPGDMPPLVRFSTSKVGGDLGEVFESDSGVVLRRAAGPFSASSQQRWPLDQGVASWVPTNASEPWRLDLILQSSAGDSGFRLCWNMNFPGVRRLACGKHRFDSGQFFGVYVIDDSTGNGTLRTWDTNNNR